MNRKLLLLLVLPLSACSTARGMGVPWPAGSGDVVVVNDEDREVRSSEGPRTLRGVPRGHYPPPGECRIWYPDRPAGHQPPPAKCDTLLGRVPFGAFLLYNDKDWDTRYDWRSLERSRPGAVPAAVLRIMDSVRRSR